MGAMNTSNMNVTDPSHVNGMDAGNQNNEFLNFGISQEDFEKYVAGAQAPVMPPTPPVVRNDLSTDNSGSTRSVVGLDFSNPFGQVTEMLLQFLSDNTVFVIAVMLLVLFMALLLVTLRKFKYQIWSLLKYNLIKRISNVTDLPENISGISLSGIVTSVMDGDGFKFYHVPWFRSSKHKSKDPKLKVRLAGIDAPECAFNGKPAQPFSDEAKWHLNDLVFGKNVSLKLIKNDIYNRLLAVCFIKKSFIRSVNVNLKMVEDGLACVYHGADAQYDGMLNDFKRAEANAKNKKLGMWKQNNYVSPMDHKRQWGADKKKITQFV